jgi:hypothetical protein
MQIDVVHYWTGRMHESAKRPLHNFRRLKWRTCLSYEEDTYSMYKLERIPQYCDIEQTEIMCT